MTMTSGIRAAELPFGASTVCNTPLTSLKFARLVKWTITLAVLEAGAIGVIPKPIARTT